MAGELLIKSSKSLDDFVASLPDVIGCKTWEQRQSSHYIEERYYHCIVLGIEVTAAIADSSEFPECDLWIFFEPCCPTLKTVNFLDGVADCAARALTLGGYEVVRLLDAPQHEGSAIRYQMNPNGEAKLSERITTVMI